MKQAKILKYLTGSIYTCHKLNIMQTYCLNITEERINYANITKESKEQEREKCVTFVYTPCSVLLEE